MSTSYEPPRDPAAQGPQGPQRPQGPQHPENQQPDPHQQFPRQPYQQQAMRPYPQQQGQQLQPYAPQRPTRTLPPTDYMDAKGRTIYRLPAVPVDYQHVLRGRGYRRWKPVVSLVVLIALALAAQLAAGLVLGIGLAVSGDTEVVDAFMELDMNNPWVLLVTMGSLAILIPLAMVAVRGIHGVRGGYLSSVAGRFRWGWAATVAAVLIPIFVAYLLVNAWFEGGVTFAPADNWPLMVALILVLTPLQSAGEEYAFRGFVLQSVGSWFANRWVALVVSGLVSAVLFSLAHGSLDPGILLNLALFAALAVYLTWRTGGLEAAIVMHATNNVTLFLFDIASGNVNSGIIGAETSQPLWLVLPSIVLFGIVALVVTWLARRRGVQRMFRPVPVPPPAYAHLAPGYAPGLPPRS